MDPFILWELFQCQTLVLSVFSGAERQSVFVNEKKKRVPVLKLINGSTTRLKKKKSYLSFSPLMDVITSE